MSSKSIIATTDLEMVDKTVKENNVATDNNINQIEDEMIEVDCNSAQRQYSNNNKKFLAVLQEGNDIDNTKEDEEEDEVLILRENLSFLRQGGESATTKGDDESSLLPLAWTSTTPYWTRWGVPLLSICIHGLFLYGQIQPMWRLYQSQDVNIQLNATTEITLEIFKAINITDHFELSLHDESTIQSFTYGFAIKELWEAKGLPAKSMARLAAILLMVSSGLWPHLKLLLLNWTWLKMRNSGRRKKFLYWLSRLGKWSLADILVVCIMIGIVHVDWYVNPEEILNGIGNNLPFLLKLLTNIYTPERICLNILPSDCLYDPLKNFNCNTCLEAFRNPNDTGSIGRMILKKGIIAGGNGFIQLRIIGMKGVYAFCIAIILSILLSVFVDMLDHKARNNNNFAFSQIALSDEGGEGEEEDGILLSSLSLKEDSSDERITTSLSKDENQIMTIENNNNNNDFPSSSFTKKKNELSSEHELDQNNEEEEYTTTIPTYHQYYYHNRSSLLFYFVLSVIILFLTILSCFVPTMERKVSGAIPKLLQEVLGIEWTRSDSLQSLSTTLGTFGQKDYLLRSTFYLFVVFGPILQSIMFFCSMVIRQNYNKNNNNTKGGYNYNYYNNTIKLVYEIISAFCAWEVFIIGISMNAFLIPSITGTLFANDLCNNIDEETPGQCFQIHYNLLPTFIILIISLIAITTTSMMGGKLQ